MTAGPKTLAKLASVSLPSETTRKLEELTAGVGPTATSNRIAALIAPVLPADVHDALLSFRHARDHGALLIHGVGPGEVPEPAATYADLPCAGPLLLGLVSLAATPAYAGEEWDGSALTDIKVTAGLEQTVSSKGMLPLPLHQETQHLERPPDGLALLMVRGGSPTRIAPSVDVLEHMRVTGQEAQLDALRRAQFVHKMPDSFGGGGVTAPTPVLFGREEMPELKVDLSTTRATTDLGQAALEALGRSVEEVAFDLELLPGSLLMLDNRRWLHGRGQLKATPASRWLVRALFVFDSWLTQRGGADGETHGLMVSA